MTRRKRKPPDAQPAQTTVIETGILNSDQLVAPTPRRDPVECALEDARDYLRLWGPNEIPEDAHDLISRLSNLLAITHDLLEDYITERDLARKLLDQQRLKSLIAGAPQ